MTDVLLPSTDDASELALLDDIQQRVLWLATSMIHHANHVRESRSGLKIGGHQSSCASSVSILTALYLAHLRAGDRVSVKPHASPVLHAINYLLGRLDRSYLTELRAFHGLQSYPSRTKDPDPIDFSTGSVGIGATATIWSALAQRYVSGHFDSPPSGRHIAVVGDAELDEGAVWEALVDPMTPSLGELMWVVDLNRQSLDRVVPDIAAGRIGTMFEAAGWQTITVKYGRQLQALFSRDGGEALRHRIDAMSNEEYQRMLRSPPHELRARLVADGEHRSDLERVVSEISDMELSAAVRDLGGHDIGELLHAFRQADANPDQPTIVFAYTVKAWKLPTQGHPGNHSALLTTEQWEALAEELGADHADPWAVFDDGSPQRELCVAASHRLHRPSPTVARRPSIPTTVGRGHANSASTQQALGRLLVDLARVAPEVASRIVTVSPDVASSTNLGAWINKTGVWNPHDRFDWFSDDAGALMKWRETARGQHVELGIAEGNLVGLLAELGSTWSRDGQPLFPIGTIYDPFVTRALEPWSFGMYAGGQSILIGTPSGVTLAPEGGAHQSIITPSVGLEQPQCTSWEPAFNQDLEWTLLHAIGQLGHVDGSSSYFRLSTRPVDQSLAAVPEDADALEDRRRQVIAGGYVVRTAPARPAVTLVGMGAVMPEVLDAAAQLASVGVHADIVCLTSADLLFRALQARQGLGAGSAAILTRLFPAGRSAPLVTVLDGHPHTLSFLAGIHGVRCANLGVSDFGQVGEIEELYEHFGIDSATIVGAAFDLIDGPVP